MGQLISIAWCRVRLVGALGRWWNAGKPSFAIFRQIAKTAVSDDAGDAALHQARHQDGAGGRGAGVLAAVHHQHRTGRTIFNRLALRMGAVAKHVELVEVFPRRHVAQREGLADQGRLVGTERMHILNALGAKAALNSAVATVAVEIVSVLRGWRR